MPRRFALALWIPLATLALLELVLQLGALWLTSPPTPPTDAHVALLALGDSWVAGAEAPAGQGFVEQTQRLASARKGAPVSLLNLGRSGANSAHVALTGLDAIPAARPTTILVLVGQNNATNTARVAELEAQLARRAGRAPADAPGAWTRLRTVKLARIIVANARGTEGYADRASPPRALPFIPSVQRDIEGRPVLDAARLADGLGALYLARSLDTAVPPDQPAWAVLFAAARRAAPPQAAVEALGDCAAQGDRVLCHYALLRAAREAEDWRAVRSQGGALLAIEERSALRDLGAAEAALLAGDWRLARALVIAAARRAPGFADVQDLACRFPATAADVDVQEACEAAPAGLPTALDLARVRDGTLDPEGAAEARAAWLAVTPGDLATRVDLATWRAHTGDLDGADALMGLAASAGAVPEPVRPSADHWRYYVLRVAEGGDPDAALEAIERALADQAGAPPSAPLLGAVASVLAEFARCDRLPEAAAAWHRVRGDAAGFGAVLGRCLPPGEVAARLAALQASWDPTGPVGDLWALGADPGDPFARLARDLDLVAEAARDVGAHLVLLTYPNPSEDHAVLADVLLDYAAARGVDVLDLRAAFERELSPEAWDAELGPNGHCNAAGYARMASLIDAHLARQDLP